MTQPRFIEPKTGMVLGKRYQLGQLLGHGGFGSVFRATDRLLDIECALKFLDPSRIGDKDQVSRFKREILIGRKVQHENVCQIYDFGEIAGMNFISMEFVEGMELKERLESDPPLRFSERMKIMQQICSAVEVAHRQGVVHRDLKLENVMLDGHGNVKVMDFGIARSEEMGELTRPGNILGTTRYLSPEQWQSKPADSRSDVYALGVLMYYMFTGQPPFDGDFISLCFNHVHTPPPRVLELNPEVPPALGDVIERCVRKRPETRFADAGELGRALDEVRQYVDESDEPTGKRASLIFEAPTIQAATTMSQRIRSWSPLTWVLASLCLTLGTAVLTFVILLLIPVEEPVPEPPEPKPTAVHVVQAPTPVPEPPTPGPTQVPTPNAALAEARAAALKLFDQGVYISNSEPLDALRAYQRVLQMQPADADALGQIGEIAKIYRKQGDEAFGQGRYDVALEQYAWALRADPVDPELRQQFEATMEKRKSAATAEQKLDDARRALGRFEPKQAQDLLAAVLRDDPASSQAAELQKLAGEQAEAVERLTRAKGQAEAGQELAAAAAELEALQTSYPDWPEPKELLREVQRKTEARRLVEEARQLVAQGSLDRVEVLLATAAIGDPAFPELAAVRGELEQARVAEAAARKQAVEQEEARRRTQEEEERKRLAAAEDEARKKAADEERQKIAVAETERQRLLAEEERKRKSSEEEARKKAAEQERQRLAAEEAARSKSAEAAKIAAEEARKKQAAEDVAKAKPEDKSRQPRPEPTRPAKGKPEAPSTEVPETTSPAEKEQKLVELLDRVDLLEAAGRLGEAVETLRQAQKLAKDAAGKRAIGKRIDYIQADIAAKAGLLQPGDEPRKPDKGPSDPPGQTGTVKFRIKPWAQVSVDGTGVGVAPPLKPLQLAPGKHSIVLENPELKARVERTVEVKAGQEIRVEADLTVGTLVVETQPPAKATLREGSDGPVRDLGMTPVTVEVPAGRELELTLEVGGKIYRYQLQVPGGGRERIKRTLGEP